MPVPGFVDIGLTMPDLVPLDQERPRLIFNRRAVAAGIAALLGVPSASAQVLSRLTNVPLTFDPNEFSGQMQGGLFLPDYRRPMVRLVFEDGHTTAWNTYLPNHTRRKSQAYPTSAGLMHVPKQDTRAVAMECCAPDANGNPRYAQLAIG